MQQPHGRRRPSHARLLILLGLAFIALANLSSYLTSSPSAEQGYDGSLESDGRSWWGHKAYDAPPLAPTTRTLRFLLCNGFTNQRLSLVYGVLYAKATGRAVVLPEFVADGTQTTPDDLHASPDTVTATPDNHLPFSLIYDVRTIVEQLTEFKIQVVTPSQAPPVAQYTNLSITSLGLTPLQGLQAHGDLQHIAIDCPLFSIAPSHMDIPKELDLIWGVLEGLYPSRTALRYLKRVVKVVRQLGGTKHYDLLHLRVETDWKAHCARWEHMADGVVRDNCYNNTETIHKQLKGGQTLYVASYWEHVDAEGMAILERLKTAGYRVITHQDVMRHVKGMSTWPRERLAMIEYQLGLSADKFIGNSVSSFSALLLLQRRNMGRWAAYYNQGNIPLTTLLPGIHKLPWVFTFNSWSPQYEHMLKVAVLSAERLASVRPYCVFSGNASSHIYEWLTSHGVTMINHLPSWRDQLVSLATVMHDEGATHHTSPPNNTDLLVGTFQRVDIAILEELMQYTYVLYTDSDVYFRQPVHLYDFGYPLPQAVGLIPANASANTSANAGVMLMNLPYLRETYDAFLKFILHDNGAFGQYRPLDQHMYSQFYEREIKSFALDHRMNAHTLTPFTPDAAIFHWHGPKPYQYMDYVRTGACSPAHDDTCEQAILTSLCPYIGEWFHYLRALQQRDELGDASVTHFDAAQQLLGVCRWLDVHPAPETWMGDLLPTNTMKQLHAKKWVGSERR